MARYLVTGGCGFIGSHLVEQLLYCHHEVVVLDDLSTGKRHNIPNSVTFIQGDVTHVDLVKACMSDVDGCFHLAAIASVEKSHQAWLKTHQVNLTATINVFDAAKTANGGPPIPVVYASSAAVYGHTTGKALTEQACVSPLSAYGVDKYACELHGQIATNIHHVPTIGARFFNVYGPRQDPNSPYSGVMSIFFDRLMEGTLLTIYGDGEQSRDFIYVADVTRFLELAMIKLHDQSTASADVYNVCTQTRTSINRLAQCVSEKLDCPLLAEYRAPRTGDIRHSLGDSTKAAIDLAFSAQTPLETGLQNMVVYCEEMEALAAPV